MTTSVVAAAARSGPGESEPDEPEPPRWCSNRNSCTRVRCPSGAVVEAIAELGIEMAFECDGLREGQWTELELVMEREILDADESSDSSREGPTDGGVRRPRSPTSRRR